MQFCIYCWITSLTASSLNTATNDEHLFLRNYNHMHLSFKSSFPFMNFKVTLMASREKLPDILAAVIFFTQHFNKHDPE